MVQIQLESDDPVMVEKLQGGEVVKYYHMTTPDVIESDYYSQYRYCRGAELHVHCIVKNSLQEIKSMALGNETSYQFDGKIGTAFNKMVLGMIYQWKISCLELIEQVQEEEDVQECYVEKQKKWIKDVIPRLMCAIEDFHNLVPLVVLKRELLGTYLGSEAIADGEQLTFVYNMISCRSYQIVTILNLADDEYKIGTRFDERDHCFFAFGF